MVKKKTIPIVRQRVPVPRPPAGSKSVALVFNVTRGMIDGTGKVPPQNDCCIAGAGSRERANILSYPVSAEGQKTSIEIKSKGERLELVKVVFQGANQKALAVYAPEPGSCPEDPDKLTRIAVNGTTTGAASLFGAAEYAAAMMGLLNSNDPDDRDRQYFAKLNLHTHPELMDSLPPGEVKGGTGHRKDLIKSIKDSLTTRLPTRLDDYLKDPTTPKSYTETPATQHDTGELSDLQLGFVREYFGLAGGDVDVPAFGNAFMKFANGSLRYQLPNLAWAIQPSSGYFFFFAEFAFLAIDSGCDPNLWRRLAPYLVRAQHAFASAYRPRDPQNATISSYGSCDYGSDKALDDADLAKLEVTYPYPDEDALRLGAADNIKQYLPKLPDGA